MQACLLIEVYLFGSIPHHVHVDMIVKKKNPAFSLFLGLLHFFNQLSWFCISRIVFDLKLLLVLN